MEARATINQYTIDNALNSYEAGRTKWTELEAELRAIYKTVERDIDKLKKEMINSKYPKASSYDNAIKLVGEAQRTRAYTLLSQDISVIKNEMKRGIDEGNFDFVFTLAEGVYNNNRFSNSEQYSIDKIFREALEKQRIFEKAKEKNKLGFVLKELDAIFQKVGSMDASQLLHHARFERARYELVYTKQENDLPKKPYAELINDF